MLLINFSFVFFLIRKSDIHKTYSPVSDGDGKVDSWEDNDEDLVNIPGWTLLILLATSSISDIDENNSIGENSGDNEDILDENPGSEGRDTNSYWRTEGDGGDKESCKRKKESYQETHPARNNLNK